MQETRRVRMTKKLIKEAYVELLETNPDNRLSITDICKCADINRSTFYMHYEDVNQLIKEIEDDVLAQIPYIPDINSTSSDSEFVTLLEKTFEYVKMHKTIFLTLMAKLDNNRFKKRIISTVLEGYKKFPLNNDGILSKYSYLFCINGIIGLLIEWINDDFPISSKALADFALQMSYRATDLNKIN